VKPLYAAGFLGPLERANQRVELQVEPVALGLDLFPRGIAQDTGEPGVELATAFAVLEDLGELQLPAEGMQFLALATGRLALSPEFVGDVLRRK